MYFFPCEMSLICIFPVYTVCGDSVSILNHYICFNPVLEHIFQMNNKELAQCFMLKITALQRREQRQHTGNDAMYVDNFVSAFVARCYVIGALWSCVWDAYKLFKLRSYYDYNHTKRNKT